MKQGRSGLVYRRAVSAELYVIFAYEFMNPSNFVYKKRPAMDAGAVFLYTFYGCNVFCM